MKLYSWTKKIFVSKSKAAIHIEGKSNNDSLVCKIKDENVQILGYKKIKKNKALKSSSVNDYAEKKVQEVRQVPDYVEMSICNKRTTLEHLYDRSLNSVISEAKAELIAETEDYEPMIFGNNCKKLSSDGLLYNK